MISLGPKVPPLESGWKKVNRIEVSLVCISFKLYVLVLNEM